MDAEDAHRLLERTRTRCQRLEADKDAAILRAGKYRKIILDKLAGEGATQPQAADIFCMPRRALVCTRVAASVMASG
jgi:hypothetical protein